MKALDYEIINYKGRDNITTKLTGRAEHLVAIITVNALFPSISNSCFFTMDCSLRSVDGWMISKIIILVFYPRK